MTTTAVEPLLDELAELLRIPSMSADPAHAGDVRRAAEWVAAFLRDAGGDAEVVDWEGSPLAVGELRASTGADSAPTVLVYGHFDVQPPDPLDLWESDPVRARRARRLALRARDRRRQGAALPAPEGGRGLAAEGALPVNVRFACDGEEEVGGHSIIDFLADEGRGADAAVIFDADMPARGVPAFYVATRGIVYMHLRVRAGERDLHSGMYGGAALNAMHALAQTLVRRGCRATGGCPSRCARGRPADRGGARRLALARPRATSVLADQGARPADPRAARGVLPPHLGRAVARRERHRGRVAVPAEDGHPGAGRREPVDPARAGPGPRRDVRGGRAARCGRRRRRAPTSSSSAWSRAPPGLVEPGSPAIQLAQDAFERALGTRPLLLRSGGSLPIVPALGDRGIPTVITGFALPESNVHSPNERLLLEYVPLGVAAARELFVGFAGLG